ncbi:MAG: hypothetical protein M1836_002652 [Candelina mexicana]|nr:MAG: hypothetical protein M1836_002652 [Candelina mexicana]
MSNRYRRKDTGEDKTRRDDYHHNRHIISETGGSSSKGHTKKPVDPSESLARRLQNEADANMADTPRRQLTPAYDDSPYKGKGKDNKARINDSRETQPPKSRDSINKSGPGIGEYPDKIQEALNSLREYHTRVMTTKCHKCRYDLTGDFSIKGHIRAWEDALDSGRQECISAARCPISNCVNKTCLGCGKAPKLGINKATSAGKVLDWCCDGGKLFAIWLFLARYDELELDTQAATAKAVEDSQKKARKYGTDPSKGAGYSSFKLASMEYINWAVGQRVALGLNTHDPGSYGVSNSFNFKSSDLKTDKFVKMISGFLYHLLPNENHKTSKTSFETNPPSALKAMLQLSLLLDKLAQLLRNDSIGDLTSRADSYFKILRLVQAIGGHRGLVSLINEERYAKRSTTGLKVLSLPASKRLTSHGRNELQHLLILEDESATSVISYIENLYKQSQMILSQYKNLKTEFADSAGKDTIMLCEEIVRSYDIVVGTSKSKGSGPKTNKSEWEVFHATSMVEETDDVETRYYFTRELEYLRCIRTPPKGRMQYLVTEIATLTTSLPDGIFVKISPATPGVMKCLIIGPADTPYEGGLFEFDIFAGARYPIEPPRLFFRTTAGGTVHFNPNLHPDGKTCLSLIGTFPAISPEEQWQAKKSTILQVLISIQSMSTPASTDTALQIFCETPYQNEPGFADEPKESNRALRYNAKIQALTVNFAMLYWLNSKSQMGGIWASVIKQHYRLRGKNILKTVKKWASGNPHLRRFGYSGLTEPLPRGSRDLVAELEEALRRV